MPNTNRDNMTKLREATAPRASDSSSDGGLHHLTGNAFTGQKRTRSQFNVSDTVLRLPLARSPFKDARKAHAKAWTTSQPSQEDQKLHTPEDSRSSAVEYGKVAAGPSTVTETSMQETIHREREDEDLEVSTDGREQRYKDPSLIENRPTMWPTGAKKRASPDTDAAHALSGPRSERQAKRSKTEALRSLGRRQEHPEYREPLRDPDTTTPRQSKGHKRASSIKPTPSPTKVTSSNFPPRAKSVPLGGENEVTVLDLISIPPSPRRSPTKGAVEIRRAPSVPPPDDDRMDVDVEDTSGLLHFTNPTLLHGPRANPVFRYTVNFASPRKPATPPRSGLPSASPLSPLTPLPGSPSVECLPEIHNVLANANPKLRVLSSNMDAGVDTPTRTAVTPSTADMTASVDRSQLAIHVSTQYSSSTPTSDLPAEVASQPGLTRPSPALINSKERIPTTIEKESNSIRDTIVAGGSGQSKDTSLNNTDAAGTMMTDVSSELSSLSSSSSSSKITPISRRSVIGAMKPRRGPSTHYGPKRVTRSVSMKEQTVTSAPEDIEDTAVSSYTSEVLIATKTSAAEPSSGVATRLPPSTTGPAKHRPPKSTGTTSKSRAPPITQRSISVSIPSDAKLKQTSLNMFMKPKPPTVGGTSVAGSSTASTSTSTASTSKVVPNPSPSKIPLPASPLKRTLTTQLGNSKPFQFSAGGSRGTPGRSLRTLSHALDKLVVPPPSRPNTSMGFVRADGTNEETDTPPENGKGKAKAKDDTALPAPAQGSGSTFARPTASSLQRAATMTGLGSTMAAKMRGRGGAAAGGSVRGKGMIGIFGRPGDRASKKTSLPVVAGSPVKGSGRDPADLDGDSWGGAKGADSAMEDSDVFVSRDGDAAAGNDPQRDAVMEDVLAEPSVRGTSGHVAAQGPSPLVGANAGRNTDINLTSSPISADKGKQRTSTLNPASAALHALSESLSSLPQTPTPPNPRVLGTRTGLRSSTAAGKESPAQDGSRGVGPAGSNEVHGSGGAGPSSGTVHGSGGVKKSSLKILKRCAIFVDVRTEQGDDAGSVFVDMLKGLGAKIMGRLGQTCTHIVYKNGHPNTLTRYRLLNDPKPVVVGIAWVVECAEQRARVDETRFKIDVDLINVAGGNNKHRRSMLPKHLIPTSPGPTSEMTMHTSSEADDDGEGVGGIDALPSQDPDTSIRSRDDDLPPLERARRRRSVLPGGQTRLVL